MRRCGAPVLVLVGVLVLAGCAQDAGGQAPVTTGNFSTTGGATSPGPSVSPTQSPPQGTGTDGYVPNPYEAATIALVERLGVTDAGVDEFGFKDAWIGGQWRGGELTVHAYDDPIRAGTKEPPGPETVRGAVNLVRTLSTDSAALLACKNMYYEVYRQRGDHPLGEDSLGISVEFAKLIAADPACGAH